MPSLSSNLMSSMWFAIIGCVLLIISACSPQQREPSPPMTESTATRQLALVDEEGRVYGVMEMTPMGGANIYNAQGTMIGQVAALQ